MLPFSAFKTNYIAVMELNGSTVRSMLTHGISLLAVQDAHETPSGRFLQISRQLMFSWYLKGGVPTITTVCVQAGPDAACVPLDDTRSYMVATSSYISNGGDGFHMLENLPQVREDASDVEMTIAYLQAQEDALAIGDVGTRIGQVNPPSDTVYSPPLPPLPPGPSTPPPLSPPLPPDAPEGLSEGSIVAISLASSAGLLTSAVLWYMWAVRQRARKMREEKKRQVAESKRLCDQDGDEACTFWFLDADRIRPHKTRERQGISNLTFKELKKHGYLKELKLYRMRRRGGSQAEPVENWWTRNRELVCESHPVGRCSHLVISHRWLDKHHPDKKGEQLAAIEKCLELRPDVKWLWFECAFSPTPCHPSAPAPTPGLHLNKETTRKPLVQHHCRYASPVCPRVYVAASGACHNPRMSQGPQRRRPSSTTSLKT